MMDDIAMAGNISLCSLPTGTCRRTRCAFASAWSAGKCSPATSSGRIPKSLARHQPNSPLASSHDKGKRTEFGIQVWQ
jgi:hypothetical protein